MTRRVFLSQAAAACGVGFAAGTEHLIFVSMEGGPSHTDLFDFQAGPWTPDWMDPVRGFSPGFPRGLMPALAGHLNEIRLVRGLRAASRDHRVALSAHPACDVSLRADRASFIDACAEARGLAAWHRSIRIDFGSWDHHGNLYENLRPMCAAFDRGIARLIEGLKRDRRDVRVVAMGEFGRTPGPLNQNRGRDHHPVHAALTWSAERGELRRLGFISISRAGDGGPLSLKKSRLAIQEFYRSRWLIHLDRRCHTPVRLE